MENWKRELQAAIERGLQKSDEEDELENEMFLEALEQLVEVSLPPQRPAQWGGSMPGRRYVFRKHKLCHA
jgi:hypothetical protein